MLTVAADVDARTSVRLAIRANAACDGPYLTMNGLATVIAAYGLLENSAAVIIGAMVVAMLLGPVTGIALGLVDQDNGLLTRAFSTLVCGVGVVYGIGLVLGALHATLPLTPEIYARTAPNLMDLMVALAGGAAGACALGSDRVNGALVGVAISTALVPPLVASAICLARGAYTLSAGAMLLVITNMVAIQVASSAVFWLRGYRGVLEPGRAIRRVFQRNVVSVALLLALTVALTINLQRLIQSEVYQASVRRALRADAATHEGAYLADVRFAQDRDHFIVTAVYRTPVPFTPEQVRTMERALPRPSNARGELELRVRSIPVTVASRAGYLFAADDADLTAR
jgi:uncharacterized hydrophobic protein (TIGR00271 family)